uniref:histone deacetylase n=1 Tax=Mycena chlorophos TaxID=658473 RepID=A0ABQ0L526_MYCCL|nr:histone deacetylase RPD3 [Mycena chlorophos]
MSRRRVAYYYDPDVGGYTYGPGHPMKPHRVRITHDLVGAYGMLDKMHVLRPQRATPNAMSAFHTDEYVNFLKRVTPETSEQLTHGGLLFLVGELPDNPAFEGLFEYCSISAGGSIAAAQRLTAGAADITINWAGGLHHAKKGEASGFCFVNDIVLCILELLRTYARVLYIDIDIHHGDGVEEAFYTTDRVMCASFHKFGEFFPGTGTQDDCGRGKGKGYSLNVPLDDGITDEAYRSVFEPVMAKIMDVFQPTAIVLQCGADSLSGDKLGGFNLSLAGHAACVQFMRRYNLPMVLLGGGGYTVKNVARAWTYETACAVGVEGEIPEDLPWCEYFEWFGPRYRLEVAQSNMEDLNLRDGALDRVRRRALAQLQELASRAAPSVALQDVPRQALGSHMGFRSMKGLRRDAHGGYGPGIPDPEDELDLRVRDRVGTLFDHQETARLERERQQDDSDASSSDDSEGSEDEEDDDTRSGSRFGNGNNITGKRRKRMSIVTNQYIDVAPPPPRPNGRHASVPVNAQATIPPLVAQQQQGPALLSVPANKRRFFQVFPTPWDAHPNAHHVLNGISPGAADVGAAMENGGVDVDIEDDGDVEPEPEPEREERTGRGVTRATVRAARERGLLRDPLAAFEDAEEMDVDMDSDGEPARKRGGNWRGRAAPKGKGGGRGRGANRGRAIAITNREDTQSVADSNGVDREMDLEGPEEDDGEDGDRYGAARMRSGMGW